MVSRANLIANPYAELAHRSTVAQQSYHGTAPVHRLESRIKLHSAKLAHLNGTHKAHARQLKTVNARIAKLEKSEIPVTRQKVAKGLKKLTAIKLNAPTPKGRKSAIAKRNVQRKKVHAHHSDLKHREREVDVLKAWKKKHVSAMNSIKRAHAKERQHLAKNIKKRNAMVL